MKSLTKELTARLLRLWCRRAGAGGGAAQSCSRRERNKAAVCARRGDSGRAGRAGTDSRALSAKVLLLRRRSFISGSPVIGTHLW